jgi:pimeloyl-ACP methyl ester carboxylesterase
MAVLSDSLRCIVWFFSLLAWTLAGSFTVVAQPQRPVLFIPGILGSKLCQGTTPVWGATGVSSLENFKDLELNPETGSSLVACGLVEKISLIGPFWTMHQYDDILETFASLGYVKGSNLFVFDYDWRQSNYDSAKSLKSFIERTPQLHNQPFDVVTHSMGGLVARIYLKEQSANHRVRKVVYLGTPFAGSMNSLATLSEGWGAFKNRIAGGIEVIRRVVLSFPSMYELFPRYDKCCRLGSEASYDAVDIFDHEAWLKRDWLPDEYKAGARLAVFKESLRRAAALRDLLAAPPADNETVLVAGDTFATSLYLYISKQNPSWRNWRFSKSRGDGTVPVWSAANDFVTLSGSRPSFAEHATIFTDEGVKNVLLRELVSNAPPQVRPFAALSRLTTARGLKDVRLIDVGVEPQVIAPGERTRLSVVVDFSEAINREEFSPTALLLGPDGPVALKLSETTTDSELASRRLVFSAPIDGPREAGAWRVDVSFPGQGQHAAYFETWMQR